MANELIRSMYTDYADYLLGKKKQVVLQAYFKNETARIDEEMAIALFRYAVKEVLRWTYNDVVKYMSLRVINDLGLLTAYNKLTFPPELSRESNPYYVSVYIWPEKSGQLSHQALTTLMYESVLNTPGGKFPKNYFNSVNGMSNAAACFRYAIFHTLDICDVNDIYMFFADENRAMEWMRRNKLEALRNNAFESSLEMAHYLLPENTRNNDLYEKYKKIGPTLTIVRKKINSAKLNKYYTEDRSKYNPGSLNTNFSAFKRYKCEAAVRKAVTPYANKVYDSTVKK